MANDAETKGLSERIDSLAYAGHDTAATVFAMSEALTLLMAKIAISGANPYPDTDQFFKELRIAISARRELHASEAYRGAEQIDGVIDSLRNATKRHMSALGHPAPGEGSGPKES